MEDYFKNRFKSKSKQELQKIIDNKKGYRIEAVNAAISILDKRKYSDAPNIEVEEHKEKYINQDTDSQPMVYGLNPRPFIRTFSYRDILTSFSLALLLWSFIELINYYSDERLIRDIYGKLKLIGVASIVIANHIVYKIEHGRSNNFIGRSIHVMMFVLIVTIMIPVYKLLTESSYSFTFNLNLWDLFFTLFFMSAFIVLFETLLTLFKALLNLFKWQIF